MSLSILIVFHYSFYQILKENVCDYYFLLSILLSVINRTFFTHNFSRWSYTPPAPNINLITGTYGTVASTCTLFCSFLPSYYLTCCRRRTTTIHQNNDHSSSNEWWIDWFIHHSSFIIHHSPFTIHRSSFPIHHPFIHLIWYSFLYILSYYQNQFVSYILITGDNTTWIQWEWIDDVGSVKIHNCSTVLQNSRILCIFCGLVSVHNFILG